MFNRTLSVLLDTKAPELVRSPSSSIAIPIGENQLFECVFDGQPSPQVRWFINGVPLNASDRILFDDDSTELTLMSAEAADGGLYMCKATNRAGSLTYNFTLLVGGKTS